MLSARALTGFIITSATSHAAPRTTQAAVGQLLVFSRATWRTTFDDLACTLPSPDSAAERLFLYDRLRSLTREAAVRFHTTFHHRCPGRACRGTLVDESDALWGHAGPVTDPCRTLRVWLRHFNTLFDAEHEWPDVWRLAERLEADRTAILDLDALSDEWGQSRSTLTRRFRDAFGISIGGYHALARLREAWRLLRDTRLSVEQVALRVGYGEPKNLYRAFRRHTTLTPAAVRLATDRFDSHLAAHLPMPPLCAWHAKAHMATTAATRVEPAAVRTRASRRTAAVQ